MTHGKTLILVVVALVSGVGAGFVLRPMIVPMHPVAATPGDALSTQYPVAPRSKQYFAAHLDKARQVLAACKDGAVGGDECANAERAVIEADGHDRFKRFMGN